MDSRESYTNPKLVSLTQSQLEVRNLAKIDPRSSGWTRAILDIESTSISYASIGLAMVSIHISHLIGQMRGTSHESETPWVGCIRGTRSKRGKPTQYHHGGAEAHQQGLASLALWLLIAPRSPWSSHSSSSNKTLQIGSSHDSNILTEGLGT